MTTFGENLRVERAVQGSMHACKERLACQLLWKMACFSSAHTWGLRYQEEGGVQACRGAEAIRQCSRGLVQGHGATPTDGLMSSKSRPL